MLSAICFNLDQSKILSSGDWLTQYSEQSFCLYFYAEFVIMLQLSQFYDSDMRNTRNICKLNQTTEF